MYSKESTFAHDFGRLIDVNTTPQPLFSANERVAVSHFVISNGTGATQTVTFRGIGGGTTVLTVIIPAATTYEIRGWDVDTAGLELLTGTITAGLHVTAFYCFY